MTVSSSQQSKRGHRGGDRFPLSRGSIKPARKLKPFKVLPGELRNKIYASLSIPTASNPKIAHWPFGEKTYKIGKTITTISAVSSPCFGLLESTDCQESEEYKSWLLHYGTELRVNIKFFAESPSGFHLQDWDDKMKRRLENLTAKFPAVKRWPIRVWVDWMPNVENRYIHSPRFFNMGTVVSGMLHRMFSITDLSVGKVEHHASIEIVSPVTMRMLPSFGFAELMKMELIKERLSGERRYRRFELEIVWHRGVEQENGLVVRKVQEIMEGTTELVEAITLGKHEPEDPSKATIKDLKIWSLLKEAQDAVA